MIPLDCWLNLRMNWKEGQLCVVATTRETCLAEETPAVVGGGWATERRSSGQWMAAQLAQQQVTTLFFISKKIHQCLEHIQKCLKSNFQIARHKKPEGFE